MAAHRAVKSGRSRERTSEQTPVPYTRNQKKLLKVLLFLDLLFVLVQHIFSFPLFDPKNVFIYEGAWSWILIVLLTAYVGNHWEESGNGKRIQNKVLRIFLFLVFLYGVCCFLAPLISKAKPDDWGMRVGLIHAVSGLSLSAIILMCFSPFRKK